MTEEKTTRIPSNALLQKINDIVGSFGRTRDKVIAAFELGRKEGFSDMEIGDLIRAGLKKAGFSVSNMGRIPKLFFPQTAKYMKHSPNANSHSKAHQRLQRASRYAKTRLLIKQMRVEDYVPGDLGNYPKDFLIAIIRWYQEKEAILQQKQAEVQALLQPINKRRMVSSDGGPAVK